VALDKKDEIQSEWLANISELKNVSGRSIFAGYFDRYHAPTTRQAKAESFHIQKIHA